MTPLGRKTASRFFWSLGDEAQRVRSRTVPMLVCQHLHEAFDKASIRRGGGDDYLIRQLTMRRARISPVDLLLHLIRNRLQHCANEPND